MNNRRSLTSAERQRRYRQRQRRGALVIPVELDEVSIERLIDSGLLQESKSRDTNCVASAIEGLIESLNHDKD